MVSGDIDDAGALARAPQQLLHHVVVALRPVPGAAQPPAVDDVADEIDRLGLVMAQEVDQELGLGGLRPEMDVGDEKRPEGLRGDGCGHDPCFPCCLSGLCPDSCNTRMTVAGADVGAIGCASSHWRNRLMDLGIRGKKAIVCASSKGLGKGCAMALAEAGVRRHGQRPRRCGAGARRPREIRDRYDVTVTEVAGRRRRPGGAEGAACRLPRARHPGQQQWRPAASRFSRARPRGDPEGRHQQHGRADRTHPGGDRRHGRARLRPHRQHHIAVGLRADSRASTCRRRARAGLTSFVAGVARTVADRNVTINSMLPGKLDTDRLRGAFDPNVPEDPERGARAQGKAQRQAFRPSASERRRNSARSAPSSARSMPAISPARTFPSTAGSTSAPSEHAARPVSHCRRHRTPSMDSETEKAAALGPRRGGALLPQISEPRKAGDPGDQAARQPARPGARLFAGRRRALPGNPRQSRDRRRLHGARQPRRASSPTAAPCSASATSARWPPSR